MQSEKPGTLTNSAFTYRPWLCNLKSKIGKRPRLAEFGHSDWILGDVEERLSVRKPLKDADFGVVPKEGGEPSFPQGPPELEPTNRIHKPLINMEKQRHLWARGWTELVALGHAQVVAGTVSGTVLLATKEESSRLSTDPL
jgi:hypothetical protein